MTERERLIAALMDCAHIATIGLNQAEVCNEIHAINDALLGPPPHVRPVGDAYAGPCIPISLPEST